MVGFGARKENGCGSVSYDGSYSTIGSLPHVTLARYWYLLELSYVLGEVMHFLNTVSVNLDISGCLSALRCSTSSSCWNDSAPPLAIFGTKNESC